jgi:hypothetical protein
VLQFGDILGRTDFELEVDELASVVAVQPEQGEREPPADLLQGFWRAAGVLRLA